MVRMSRTRTWLGIRIRKLRTARGWTRADVARASGLTAPTVRNLELGLVRSPTLHTRQRLARALDVELAEMIRR